MLALLKRDFLLYLRNRSGVFFSLLGALISFLLGCDWDYNQFYSFDPDGTRP